MADVFDAEVHHVACNAPIIGRAIFTTQAGLHQSGVAKQGEANGGLIYLPYASSLVGREHNELYRVGAVSGMDGLVAILNQELKKRGEDARYSLLSRTVLALYEKVHQSYDGEWDEAAGRFSGFRKSFFEAEELLEAASNLEKES